ncbi:MAG: formylglycine-generating enzyme family protein [Bacteroidota bacterium]
MFSGQNFFFTLFLIFINVSCQTEKSPNSFILSETEAYKIEFVLVNKGEFYMGNENGEKDEKPRHLVKLNDFYISKHEVTNAQFCEFLNSEGKSNDDGIPYIEIEDKDCKIQYNRKGFYPKVDYINHPVIEVTWYGANAYSKWKGGRLPTEAEWEYAAKGGSKSEDYKYSGSNNPDKVAWYDKNSQGRTHVVGTKMANELGLYDMSGNVWEWTNDYYRWNYYRISPTDNPEGPEWSTVKAVRGGSWGYNEDYLRPSFRKINSPDAGNFNLGFRVVKDSL